MTTVAIARTRRLLIIDRNQLRKTYLAYIITYSLTLVECNRVRRPFTVAIFIIVLPSNIQYYRRLSVLSLLT